MYDADRLICSMVGIYNAADIADRYSNMIYLLLWGIDMRHNGNKVRGDMKKAFMSKCTETLGAAATKSAQEVCPDLDKVIAIATQMIRAFVSFSPKIKKEVRDARDSGWSSLTTSASWNLLFQSSTRL
jgi:hypothetical protein